MRIGFDAHMIGAHYGGNTTYAANLCRALAEVCPEDAELLLYVTKSASAQAVRDLHPRLQPVKIADVPPPLRIACMLPLRLKRDGVEVIQVQYFRPPYCPCPSVTAVHDLSFEYHPEFFNRIQRTYLKAFVPWSARRTDAVVTVSQYSKDDICKRYGVSPERVFVTHIGCGPEFMPIEDRSRLESTRQRLGLPERYVLFVSNIQPRKNLVGLMEAVSRLGAQHDDVKLVVVGKKQLGYETVERHMVELGLESRTMFVGFMSDERVADLYNMARVFVYPSFFEGFGLPPLEAMACGTPVVASNTTSIPEVTGEAAILVDPHDSDAIAEGIRSVLEKPGLAARLSRAGLEQAKTFSWQRAARENYEVYRKVTGR